MWTSRYFTLRYWAERYWERAGSVTPYLLPNILSDLATLLQPVNYGADLVQPVSYQATLIEPDGYGAVEIV